MGDCQGQNDPDISKDAEWITLSLHALVYSCAKLSTALKNTVKISQSHIPDPLSAYVHLINPSYACLDIFHFYTHSNAENHIGWPIPLCLVLSILLEAVLICWIITTGS